MENNSEEEEVLHEHHPETFPETSKLVTTTTTPTTNAAASSMEIGSGTVPTPKTVSAPSERGRDRVDDGFSAEADNHTDDPPPTDPQGSNVRISFATIKALELLVQSMSNDRKQFQEDVVLTLCELVERLSKASSSQSMVSSHADEIKKLKEDLEAIQNRINNVRPELLQLLKTGDTEFREIVKDEIQTQMGTIIQSLQDHEIFKTMLKGEVEAALTINTDSLQPATQQQQLVIEETLFKSKISEKSTLEDAETKLQGKITSTLSITQFIAFLVGFHTIVAQQPLRTSAELWLLITLMVVILLGTVLYLYSVWKKLSALKSGVTTLTEKRRLLNVESQSLVQRIMDERGLNERTEKHVSFLEDIDRDSTLTSTMWDEYRRIVIGLGVFALIFVSILGYLSYTNWSVITKLPPPADPKIKIFGRGAQSM